MINEQLESVGRKLKEESYGEVNKLMTALRMEMEHQVEIGLKAYRELEKALEEADGPEVWYSAHSFLNSIAKISDILRWCEKKRDNGLQDDMISALTSENWSLLELRSNGFFEDFGDELEDWALNEVNSEVLEKHIFSKEVISTMDECEMLRHLDPESHEFTFRGKTYDLAGYHKEILELKEYIQEGSYIC